MFFGFFALALVLVGLVEEPEPPKVTPVEVQRLSELVQSPFQDYLNPPEYVGDGC